VTRAAGRLQCADENSSRTSLSLALMPARRREGITHARPRMFSSGLCSWPLNLRSRASTTPRSHPLARGGWRECEQAKLIPDIKRFQGAGIVLICQTQQALPSGENMEPGECFYKQFGYRWLRMASGCFRQWM
jgi:hypothetical protein